MIALMTSVGVVLAMAGEDAARPLPRVTTICRADVPGPRCWTEPGESRCTTGAVFRIVIDGPDVARALDDCRRPPDDHRSQ